MLWQVFLPVVEGAGFVDGGVWFVGVALRVVGVALQVVGVVVLIIVVGHLAVDGWLLG